jgi:hypothetical protein
MTFQIDRESFAKALAELGHDPQKYKGQKISLENMSLLYSFSQEALLEAIEKKALGAHYDYKNDTIWIDALEAAHFYYCVSMTHSMYTTQKSMSRNIS